ncbi:Rad1-domain-containing protein [Gonapodya prolifera JEL478]|uniref:Rad1-domain-containing protein n=1 Tax=Gonapodya prolifera (strain JEL478) TaxID=1344416 RepID=A0A139A7K6_GONPJ|nr:Rad1-domain-containing protein [Gonapodya prolifera JEL478]|eukprot:KXS12669.1 Rad1-domain-containing protein [Gonapodya prolifera JEL478]
MARDDDTRAHDEPAPFSAIIRLANFRPFYNLLKCVAFRDKALFRLSLAGFEAIISDSKSVVGHAFYSAELFDEFTILGGSVPQHIQSRILPNANGGNANGDNEHGPHAPQPHQDPDAVAAAAVTVSPSSFVVSLAVFLDCLNMFGDITPTQSEKPSWSSNAPTTPSISKSAQTHSKLLLSYDEAASEVVVELSSSDCTIRAVLSTYDADDADDDELEETFREDPEISRFVIKSEWLKEAFQELDASSDRVTVLVSPEQPYFQISSSGMSGSAEIEYPKNTDIMESFSCQERSLFSYKLSLLQPSLKALAMSSRIQIKTNSRGFVSMQHLVQVSETKQSFVSFTVAPLLDE